MAQLRVEGTVRKAEALHRFETKNATDRTKDVDAARAAMIAAGELPKGMQGETKKNFAATGGQVVGAQPNAAPAPKGKQPEGTEVVGLLTFIDGQQEEVVVANLEDLRKLAHETALQLREQGQPSRISVTYKFREIGSTEGFVTEPEAPATAATPVQSTTPEPQDENERQETKDFIAEIRREGGQWVGELTYKNGAGSEKFTAKSKAALTMAMLIGKGNATLKVRKVIRDTKVGVDLDRSYSFDGISQEEYDALSPAAKQKLVDAAAAEATYAFVQHYPEYYNTAGNSQTIRQFMETQKLPYTFKNLQYAYQVLLEDDLLEQRPKVAPVSPSAAAGDSSAPVTPPPAASAPVAPASPAPVVRKRASFGLQPGFSSAGDTADLETAGNGTDGKKELSEAEARTMPLDQLRRIVRKGYKQPYRNY